MTQNVEKLLRLCSLIILGCAFLLIVLVSAATSSTRRAAQSGPSPSLVTTAQEPAKERPNPVRRFFSWVKETVSRPFRKRVRPISDPPIVRITPSTSLITFCPPWTNAVDCSARREVDLTASAGGPDVESKLIYMWVVSAGRIRGEGQKVIWDLSDAAEGTYTANVEVNDGTGFTANDSTKVTVALCHSCITKESPCPTIAVSCPENAKSNQSMTFQAHVYGGDPAIKSTYTWSVSAGKISGGQGTSMITVDVSDVTSGSVTATVSVGGHEQGCSNTASCTTFTARGVANRAAGIGFASKVVSFTPGFSPVERR